MKDSMIRITTMLTVAASMSTTTSIVAETPQRYILEPIEQWGIIDVWDLNDAGDISGYLYSYDETGFNPFIWNNGTLNVGYTDDDVYGKWINEAGTAIAQNNATDHLILMNEDGITDLGYVGYCGNSMWLTDINANNHVIGSRRNELWNYVGFTWNPVDGFMDLGNETVFSSTIDINDAGDIVGQITDDDSAYAYLVRDGVRIDFGLEWEGTTTPLSIDNAGRILLRQSDFPEPWKLHMLDANNLSSIMHTVIETERQCLAEANAHGHVVLCWLDEDKSGSLFQRMAFWSPNTGRIDLPIPDDVAQVIVQSINDEGDILAWGITEEYETRNLLFKAGEPTCTLENRVIGHARIHDMQTIDINNLGQIAMQMELTTENSAGLLTPARPGDVDGDGNVGVNDLLAVISAWGDWPVGSICGPDLDMDGSVNVNDLLAVISDWH